MNRLATLVIAAGLCIGSLAGCSKTDKDGGSAAENAVEVARAQDMEKDVIGQAPESYADAEKDEDLGEAEEYVYTPPESEPSLKLGDSFPDHIVAEGQLFYTINKCELFHNIGDCSLKKTDFDETNIFYDRIGKNGEIDPEYVLVMLDVNARNVDALGMIKKTEFNIYGIILRNIEDGTVYHPAYFSEAKNSPVEGQLFYYNLEQDAEMQVKLGYLVPLEEVEAGMIKGESHEKLIELGLGKE